MSQISIWPAEGLTVYAESGVVIPSTGLVVEHSDYYLRLLREGQILTYNPLYDSAPTAEELQNSQSVALYATDLATQAGRFDRAVVYLDGYSSAGDGGGGPVVWVEGSAATVDGGTIFGTTASGRWKRIYSSHINVRWFGVRGDGTTNDAPLLDTAIQTGLALGKPVYIPAGTYRLASTVSIRPTVWNIQTDTFASGPKIYGDGIGNTIMLLDFAGVGLDIQAQDDPISVFRGLIGLSIEHLTIKQTSAYASTTAIKVRGSYLVRLSQLHIHGGSSKYMDRGIWIPTNYGDNDASNQTIIEHVRVENVKGWGIKADADPATNESSYLSMSDVFIQNCGVDDAATPPPSGAMIWKGQCLTMRDCGFAANLNIGLYIPGGAGLSNTVTLDSTTLENNKRRGLYCTGVVSFKARNLQLYSNDDNIASVGVEFSGATYTVRKVELDGITVRATSANSPYTAFKISGTYYEPDSCRVRNVEWNIFDFAGQTRFDGWKFDPIPSQCGLEFVNNQIVRFHPIAGRGGNGMPLRLAGPVTGGTTASVAGEWIPTTIETNEESIVPTTGSGPEVPGTLIEGGSYAASTRYHVYLWDDAGNRKISLSATAPTIDAVSGYLVRTGDVAKLWVGCITTTSAASPNIRWSHVENAGEGLTGSAVYDPANLVDGAGATTTVTCTGATLGDFADATFSLDLQGITLTAWVSAADTVSVRFQNESGGAIDLASGILRVRARRA